MRLGSLFSVVALFLAVSVSVMAQINKEMIDEVRTGIRDTARAEWWGFDKEDATDALQAALNSGARKVIIGKMVSPWTVRPIELPSDIEVIFEEGVVVRALPGAYEDINDCLFRASGRKNIVLNGFGASLIMNKKDYQDETRYQFSEWRHAISLLSSANVTIKGLTISESGGDGIYVGILRDKERDLPNYCKDIVIEDVICDSHHRQGISVISVENLLIRNCRLSRTDGTAPMAGIDFEPNNGNERLVNCVMENCILEDNKAYGFVIHTKLYDTTSPISITLRGCRITGGGRGIVLSMPLKRMNPAKGFVKFEDCHITKTRDAAIEFRNMSANGFKTIFTNCTIENSVVEQPRRSPIMFSMSSGMTHNTGNAEFSNCVVIDNSERPVIQLNNLAGNPVVENVTGNLTHNGTEIDVAAYVTEHKLDVPQVLAVAAINPADLHLREEVQSLERPVVCTTIFRGPVKLALAAKKGERIKVELMYEQINRRFKPIDLELEAAAPSGEPVAVPDLICNQLNEISFTADETGTYLLSCDAKGNMIKIVNSSVPFSLLLPEEGYLPLYRPRGTVYFAVPADISNFKVEIAGQGSETLDAEILLEDDKVASAVDISSPIVFEIECEPAKTVRVGSISFSNVIEDVMLKLPVPLTPVISINKSELMILKEKLAP